MSARVVMLWGACALQCLTLACGSRSGLLAGDLPEPSEEATGRALEVEVEWPLLPPPPEPEPEQVGCVDIQKNYSSQPATVLMLIDRSGSMSFGFGLGRSSRWDVLRDAVTDPDDGLLEFLDGTTRMALMLYTSLDGFQGPSCPMISRVDAAVGNAGRIRAAYLSQAPIDAGDTPTGEAIDAAVRYLLDLPPLGPNYILLVTDGSPDTCERPDPQTAGALARAVQSARDAFERGIRVYTVGVSDGISQSGLQQMANAGAGKPAELRFGVDDAAEEPLSASSDPRQLARQLRGVIGDVRACTIDLDADVGRNRFADGSFELDGVRLEHGALDGWTFVDDDTVRIHGESCERILGEGESLKVTFPCVDRYPDPR